MDNSKADELIGTLERIEDLLTEINNKLKNTRRIND